MRLLASNRIVAWCVVVFLGVMWCSVFYCAETVVREDRLLKKQKCNPCARTARVRDFWTKTGGHDHSFVASLFYAFQRARNRTFLFFLRSFFPPRHGFFYHLQFSSVANVIYPDTYQQFLDVVAVVNFDLGWILSAGCIMRVDFHDGLLLATIGPLIASALLGVTYKIASHRNRSSEQAMRKVRRKHIGAIILMTFLVYSSVSSAVFRAFACDDLEDGYSYLRTDYRILCDSPRHKAFQVYAGLMIAVYPLGIPLLYGILLFRKRKVLLTNGTVKRRDGDPRGIEQYSQQSTSSLWKPYQPEVYYYEVVECGRRIMLTGVVVFIYPNTAAQISMTLAVAFMFVVISETLRPYASRWDAWVSRTGHVIVFLSMYVALLLRVDASNESQQAQDIFAGILVAAHATMILVVFIEAFALVYSLRRKEDDLSSCSTRTEKIAPTGPNDYSDDGRSEADLESKDEHKYASDKDDAVV